jgi:hypothetical protein
MDENNKDFNNNNSKDVGSNLTDDNVANSKKQVKLNNLFEEVEEEPKEIKEVDAQTIKNQYYNTKTPNEIEQKNQELIEQVKKQQGQGRKRRRRNEILMLIFIVIFIGVALTVTFYLLFSKPEEEFDYLRVSVSMTNAEDVFYYTNTEGEKIPKEINPGDSFDLRIIARNSSDILGDPPSGTEWNNIYVRFKIWLEIDGVAYPDYIKINPNTIFWHRYNKLEEPNPIVFDDGYYYYKGVLIPNESIMLINFITFDGQNITETVGGKNAQLIVQIEALEESLNDMIINWQTAPTTWINYMVNLYNEET